MTKEAPRILISFGLLGLFAFAYARNPSDQLLVGSLIGMASMAAQYWLGSSKSSADSQERLHALSTNSTGPTGKPGDPVHVEEEAK